MRIGNSAHLPLTDQLTSMKLYYSPGTCALASHIALHEAGLPFTTVRVDLKTHTCEDGRDYYGLNVRGYVPLLELDDGQHLSEGPAILQYVADLAPAKRLAPQAGTMQRHRLAEWLAFISSELHRNFGPLFDPAVPSQLKPVYRKRLADRFSWLESQLGEQAHLLGADLSVADIYLFVVTGWARLVDLDLAPCSRLGALIARIGQRPAVNEALRAEGLI